MKCQVLIVCVLIFLWLGAGIPARAQCVFDPVEYVNPLMGTQSTYELSTGNTYPAIARPWGMNFWMPVTDGLTCTRQIRFGALSKLTNPARGLTITGSFP